MPDANITKRALAVAMKSLMQDQPFAKISIGDICAACGMNRKSFYYHFRDKYDLVNWIYYTEFVETVREKNYDDSWSFIYDMCKYFYDNRTFYVGALNVTGQDSFQEYFSQIFLPIIQDTVEEIFIDSEDQRFYAVFFTDAFLLSIKRWLNENSMPPERFVSLLRTGIAGTARRAERQMAHQQTPDAPP